MQSQFVTKVQGKTPKESERLTKIANDKLKEERDRNLTASIHRLMSARSLKPGRMGYRTDEGIRKAGYKILKEFEATESEKRWFDAIVDNPKRST